MQQRFTIFVDGSNLNGDLRRLNIRIQDYQRLFHAIFAEGVSRVRELCSGEFPGAKLSRTLWYELGSIDEWDLDDRSRVEGLREVFCRTKDVKDQYLKIVGPQNAGLELSDLIEKAWQECLLDAKTWYVQKKEQIERTRSFHYGVQSDNDFIKIIECGHWKVDLLRRNVEEKRLDTALAVDMVTLADTLDIALLISGDADAIPAVQFLQRKGKSVGVVEFLSGSPPESKSKQASSRLKNEADFVVQMYETDLTRPRQDRGSIAAYRSERN